VQKQSTIIIWERWLISDNRQTTRLDSMQPLDGFRQFNLV